MQHPDLIMLAQGVNGVGLSVEGDDVSRTVVQR